MSHETDEPSSSSSSPPPPPSESSPLATARQLIRNATYNLMRFIFESPLTGLNSETFNVYQAVNILKDANRCQESESALEKLKAMSDDAIDAFDDNPEMRALVHALKNHNCLKSLRITSQCISLDEDNVLHISHVKYLRFMTVTQELTLHYLSADQSSQVIRYGTHLRHSILILEHCAITRDDFEYLMHCEPNTRNTDDVTENVPLCQQTTKNARVMDLMVYGVTIMPTIDLPFILKRLGCFDPGHSGNCSKKLIIGANSGGNFSFTPNFAKHLLDAMPDTSVIGFNHASRHHFTVMQLIGIDDYDFDKEAYKDFETRNEALSRDNLKPLIILVKKSNPVITES